MHPGDLVEFKPQKEGLLLKPVAVVDKDKVWEEEDFDAIEKLIDSQLKTGSYVQFSRSKQAINFLKKKTKDNEC